MNNNDKKIVSFFKNENEDTARDLCVKESIEKIATTHSDFLKEANKKIGYFYTLMYDSNNTYKITCINNLPKNIVLELEQAIRECNLK